MAREQTINKLSKRARKQLDLLNAGFINLNDLKSFLAHMGNLTEKKPTKNKGLNESIVAEITARRRARLAKKKK